MFIHFIQQQSIGGLLGLGQQMNIFKVRLQVAIRMPQVLFT